MFSRKTIFFRIIASPASIINAFTLGAYLFCGTYSSLYSAVKDNFPFSFTLNITSNFSRGLKVICWELSRWYAGHYYVQSTSSSNKRPFIQSVCPYKKLFGEWARPSITQEVNEPYSNRSLCACCELVLTTSHKPNAPMKLLDYRKMCDIKFNKMEN